jgi:hypothetical protein
MAGDQARERKGFVQFDDLSRTWYKMPIHYGLYRLFSLYETPVEERESIGSKALGMVCDSQRLKYEQLLESEIRDSFPGITIYKDFSDGGSNIQEMYTVEMTNDDGIIRELPIYFRRNEQSGELAPEPDTSELTERIKDVRDNKTPDGKTQSPYNSQGSRDAEMSSVFFNNGFAGMASDEYTRGDFGSLQDPGRFRHWFTRGDTWLISNFGNEKSEEIVNVDNTNYTVKQYERPGKLMTWLYWFVGSKAYDIIDGFFDPIEKAAGRILSKEGQQYIKREEYKMIDGLRRSMFDATGRIDLAYEF